MKIFFSAIPDDHSLTVDFTAKDASWEGLKGIGFDSFPRGEVELEKSGTDVFVKGRVSAVARLCCSRCLEEFCYPFHVSFRHTLRPLGKEMPRKRELELLPEDLEYGYYENEVVELDKIIEEHLILALPMKPLCREACQGLCPQCGINRNAGECECPAKGIKSPFIKLKNIIN